MITPDLVVFKGLLQATPQDEQFDLLQYTTESERTLLGSIDIGTFDPKKGIASHKERLARIHYSWFVEYFSSVEHKDQAWLLAALPEELQDRVLESLNIPKRRPSPFGQRYLASMLYDAMIVDEPFLIPQECLPNFPLLGLLHLSLSELVELIDYLGLHDVSPEIRTLISSKVLQKIEGVFSNKQKEYLKLLLGSKEPVIFSGLGLNSWDGNEKKLRDTLHKRGINRLAKTLYGQNTSFLWHLLHKFDVGRAKAIKTHLNDLHNKEAHDILNKQMQTLLNFMTVDRSI